MNATTDRVIFKRMFQGNPGDRTRKTQDTTEAHKMDTTNPVTAFGVPVKIKNHLIVPMELGDTEQPYGFSVRPFPYQEDNINPTGWDGGTPIPDLPLTILVRGYLIVKCLEGSPDLGDSVYYQSQNVSPIITIGGIVFQESTDSPKSTILIEKAMFRGPIDANGFTEISFNV
jgi:hypothetical protein